MVLKLCGSRSVHQSFENDVKTYGTQAIPLWEHCLIAFENDVKTYGTQALKELHVHLITFENDVKTYGTQAINHLWHTLTCLRMM